VKFKVPDLYRVEKIFGPPGTGKTYELLKILKQKLDYGYPKEDVLLVGYSRATAQNLKDRCKKDLNFTEEETKPIKTLHALCKKALPKPEPSLLSKADKDFFKRCLTTHISKWVSREQYTKIIKREDEPEEDEDFDGGILTKKLDLINKGRSYFKSGDTWESVRYYFDEKQDDFQFGNIVRRELEFTYNTYKDFKKKYSLMDFTDMLAATLKQEVKFPKYKIVFVDECQDLNPLMWAVINKIIDEKGLIYLAGDDDQSIFGFNCGEPEYFLNYPAHYERVLDRSYRLPRKILDFSQNIISNIGPKYRKEKVFGPKIVDGVEVQGNIYEIGRFLEDIEEKVKKDSWIMCGRTNTRLFHYKYMLMQKNLLWKTKAKSGSGNSYNYSIKTRVRDILNLWHKFATKEKLEGREICRLIQEIRSEHLNIKKKDNKPDKSSLFVSDNYYNYEDLVSKNVFKDSFKIDQEWFDYIRFGKADVQNQSFMDGGTEFELFLDADQAHDYIVNVYKKDKTLLKTEILIGTIHSVKGLEAANVVVCDVWSYPCYQNYKEKTPKHRHEEIRCAYVAVTRSTENLFMYRPWPRKRVGEHSFEMLDEYFYKKEENYDTQRHIQRCSV
jgi:superfamily I DNA/RNA helicase